MRCWPRAELQTFESQLLAASIPVDPSLYQHTLTAVELLRAHAAAPPLSIREQRGAEYVLEASAADVPNQLWLPMLRQPTDLYLAYQQRWDELTASARIAATHDLRALALPAQLARPPFNAYIGLLLLQKPLVNEVDMLLATPQRFGAIRDLLAARLSGSDADFDTSRAWQTLMRWLLYFLPARYERVPARHSEVLRRTL